MASELAESVARSAPEAPAPELRSTAGLVTYALPAAGMGFSFLLVDAYLLKYTTETLLIAPAWMALFQWLSRLWDAVSDPILGHWSDRTQTRWGRRRPWILLGALPMGAAFWMLWSPPALDATLLLPVWVGATLLLLYTGTTLIDIPHYALGAELCREYDQRTRLFAVRRLVLGVGAIAALGALAAFESQPDAEARRTLGFLVGGAGAAVVLLTSVVSVWRTPEAAATRPPRGSPFRSFRHVIRNPHARILLVIGFVQQGGVAALIAMLPFYSDHVLRTPGQTAVYIGTFLLSSFASVPLVVRFAITFDKRNLMLTGMTVVAAALIVLCMAPSGNVALVIGIGVVAGLGGGVCDAIGPALQADVIDYDEYQTGERREGAYFAVWAFVAKLSRGTALGAVALLLALIELAPGDLQSTDTVWALRLGSGLLPALLYVVGTLLFTRYRLTRDEHQRIRRALQARAAGPDVE